ncbi:MAG: peptide chain release factor N(5)-glutamine methyltransferase [Alphaproteobacteria bacterium]|nr:peptide chain release factor N(5)-glutamine methyltransferase [Alphaproteobacteria bacterium]
MTVQQILRSAEEELRKAGCDSPRLDAQLLLAEAMGIGRAELLLAPEQLPSLQQRADFNRMIAERARRRPVAKILGRKEFWSLEFLVNDSVLDPRPDSETLVEATVALARAREPADGELTICDLGTGSSCLITAILKALPSALGIGIDSSAAALAVARLNRARLASEVPNLGSRLRLELADWSRDAMPAAEIYVTNPPYVDLGQKGRLAPELDYDPEAALYAGEGGMAAYRAIVAALTATDRHPSFWLLCEIDPLLGPRVKSLLTNAGFTMVYSRDDLSGQVRMIGGHYSRHQQGHSSNRTLP